MSLLVLASVSLHHSTCIIMRHWFAIDPELQTISISAIQIIAVRHATTMVIEQHNILMRS